MLSLTVPLIGLNCPLRNQQIRQATNGREKQLLNKCADPDFNDSNSVISQIFKWRSGKEIDYVICYAQFIQ